MKAPWATHYRYSRDKISRICVRFQSLGKLSVTFHSRERRAAKVRMQGGIAPYLSVLVAFPLSVLGNSIEFLDILDMLVFNVGYVGSVVLLEFHGSQLGFTP